MKDKIPTAITIAGSDSGGGAGIQADLKTFAALGVHGTTAITAITAQNTVEVVSVEAVEPEMVRDQIRAVAEDIGIDAGKTGMLYTEGIIRVVSEEVSRYGFPLVVDPVMVAKSGASLLKPEAESALKEHLLPKATVITPNRFEAEKLVGFKIKTQEDAEVAAEKIFRMGPKAVVIKGGHLEEREAVDVLYFEGKFTTFRAPKLDLRTTHGTGCSFSAAIAAGLAKKLPVPAAVEKAKELVTLGIRFGLNVGGGYGPVNPMAKLYRESARYSVLDSVERAKALIEASPQVAFLVPEVGMNVAMATTYAEDTNDVAAVDGRIVKTLGGAKAVGNAKFGCSSHLARYILEITNHDEKKRAAINIKLSEETLKVLGELGLVISSYDRMREPEEIKRVEGMTIPWGIREAIKAVGRTPDVVYHRGDTGKEPMVVIFGENAYDLAKFLV
ncbi:MAG: bifunctional hydroxymethylpyrimidine kinase/phosphomethylpyrimidine kinase, partial [Candidatus Bathyarchaeaceae archaeon]